MRASQTVLGHASLWVNQAQVDIHRELEHVEIVKLLILFIGWCILFAVCWPLAVIALTLLPFVWLLSLPLRLVGITVEAGFALIRALLFLPARLLGLKKTG